jgi:integrase
MIPLMLHTGLRISDVATLARDCVRDGKMMLFTGKTGDHILLPIPPELRNVLDLLPAPWGGDHGYFFWNGDADRESTGRRASRSLQPAFRPSKVKNAHAHRFRHTLASAILARGGTMADMADVLGISEHIPLPLRQLVGGPPGTNLDDHADTVRRILQKMPRLRVAI